MVHTAVYPLEINQEEGLKPSALAYKFSLVTTTAENEAQARQLSEAILSNDLAACIQVMPITSFYVWDGQRREDREYLLLIKTLSSHWAPLCALIRTLHTYQTPEILRIDLADGDPSYLSWMAQVMTKQMMVMPDIKEEIL